MLAPLAAIAAGILVSRFVPFEIRELLTVIAIILILVVLLLPALQSGFGRAKRIACERVYHPPGYRLHRRYGSCFYNPGGGTNGRRQYSWRWFHSHDKAAGPGPWPSGAPIFPPAARPSR